MKLPKKSTVYDWIMRSIVKTQLVGTLTITIICLPLYYQIVTDHGAIVLLPAWIPDIPGWGWKALPHVGLGLLVFGWICWYKGDRAVNGARRAARRAVLG